MWGSPGSRRLFSVPSRAVFPLNKYTETPAIVTVTGSDLLTPGIPPFPLVRDISELSPPALAVKMSSYVKIEEKSFTKSDTTYVKQKLQEESWDGSCLRNYANSIISRLYPSIPGLPTFMGARFGLLKIRIWLDCVRNPSTRLPKVIGHKCDV